MIKNFIINGSMNLIESTNKYKNIQLEEIKYGIEALYVAVSKIIVILIIAALLNIFRETLIWVIAFNILRVKGFGLHASKSIWCWISSTIIFILFPFICKNYIFLDFIFILLIPFCLIFLAIYAPADTVKRPLINAKKRKKYKILTIIIAVIYIVIILNTNNYFIKNTLITSMLVETILILPITYKIFKLPYKNYLKYE